MLFHSHHPPSLGAVLMFKDESSQLLAGIPAKVIYIWPRFRSGDYLVTLEYDRPIRFRNEFITHIDAFASELTPVAEKLVALEHSA